VSNGTAEFFEGLICVFEIAQRKPQAFCFLWMPCSDFLEVRMFLQRLQKNCKVQIVSGKAAKILCGAEYLLNRGADVFASVIET
jgi:hypothetical protein